MISTAKLNNVNRCWKIKLCVSWNSWEGGICLFYQNHRISEPYYPPFTEKTAYPGLQRDKAQKPKPKYVAELGSFCFLQSQALYERQSICSSAAVRRCWVYSMWTLQERMCTTGLWYVCTCTLAQVCTMHAWVCQRKAKQLKPTTVLGETFQKLNHLFFSLG